MGKKNVVSIEDRIPTLKQERKKKANRRLIFYLSIFFILIAIIVYLQSSLSHVKHIEVSGNVFITDDEIIEQSKIAKQTNIWTVNESDAIEDIVENPVIHQVEVDRQLPWTIEITVSEFDHVGYIKQDESFSPILGNGQVLTERQQDTLNGDAPLIMGFSDNDYLQELTAELKDLSPGILNMISEIHWNPTEGNAYKLLLYMNDGHIVDGTIREFADKMSVYPSIVSQLEPDTKGVIHIGVGTYFEAFNGQSEDMETDSDE